MKKYIEVKENPAKVTHLRNNGLEIAAQEV